MSLLADFERIEPDSNSLLTQQACALIIRDLYHRPEDMYMPTWSDIAARIEEMDRIGVHYVVHTAGTVLGVIAVKDSVETTDTQVVELITDSTCRKSGFGRQLVCGAVQKAADAGRTSLYLYSAGPAGEFYKRLGFKPVRRGEAYALELILAAVASR